MSDKPVLNVTINEACNGWIIFVTPKYIENSGEWRFLQSPGIVSGRCSRTFVAHDMRYFQEIIQDILCNIDPETGYQMEWPNTAG